MHPVIIVSNRLPIRLARHDGHPDTEWSCKRASGGLVSALIPVLRRTGGTWVGWPGVDLRDGEPEPDVDRLGDESFELRSVWIPRPEREAYYEGFANAILWPLFHGFSEWCDFSPEYYEAYLRANERFAHETLRAAEGSPDARIWVHDYQLIPLAEMLRRRGVTQRIGFFLHIPFSPPLIFARLPWRDQILSAMLAYDHLGFQTARDLWNFCDCLEELSPATRVHRGDGRAEIFWRGRRIVAAAHPIGIADGEMEALARSAAARQVTESMREELAGRRLILGVDRLDYSKGIPQRLAAFERLLVENPELAEQLLYVQIVVPSRENVPAYQKLKRSIETEVGRINGVCSSLSRVPIRYVYGSVDRAALAALMSQAAAALVTPLCDGMNLVAKEYCDAQIREDGVLILSETAGAASQLGDGALLVNPYDVQGIAEALKQALTLPRAERVTRMRTLRRIVRRHNVFRWAEGFVDALVVGDAAVVQQAEPQSWRQPQPTSSLSW